MTCVRFRFVPGSTWAGGSLPGTMSGDVQLVNALYSSGRYYSTVGVQRRAVQSSSVMQANVRTAASQGPISGLQWLTLAVEATHAKRRVLVSSPSGLQLPYQQLLRGGKAPCALLRDRSGEELYVQYRFVLTKNDHTFIRTVQYCTRDGAFLTKQTEQTTNERTKDSKLKAG